MLYFLYIEAKQKSNRSIMTNFEKVGLFMTTFGQEVKTKPSLSTEKINNLRISLINEELEELSNMELYYPEANGSLELRELVANSYPDTTPENVLITNGSAEANFLCTMTVLEPGDELIYMVPNYLQIGTLAESIGVKVKPIKLRAEFNWQIDLDELNCLITSKTKMIAVCNPNNPTGSYLEQKEVETLADAVGLGVGLLILDEAYVSFVEQPWDSLAILNRPNVVILRSMTKDYALTGLRAGYCIASEEVISHLAAYQPDWSVNGLAQAGVMAALADTDYLTKARFEVARSKEFLIQRLNALDFEVPPSAANFLLARVGDAQSWRDRLARKGMFVRDCTSFGLPEFIRIGIRSLPDCQRLMETMEALA